MLQSSFFPPSELGKVGKPCRFWYRRFKQGKAKRSGVTYPLCPLPKSYASFSLLASRKVWETEKITQKLCIINAQEQLKRWCVISTLLIRSQKHITTQATIKLTPSQSKPSRNCHKSKRLLENKNVLLGWWYLETWKK